LRALHFSAAMHIYLVFSISIWCNQFWLENIWGLLRLRMI